MFLCLIIASKKLNSGEKNVKIAAMFTVDCCLETAGIFFNVDYKKQYQYSAMSWSALPRHLKSAVIIMPGH